MIYFYKYLLIYLTFYSHSSLIAANGTIHMLGRQTYGEMCGTSG